MVRTGLLVLCTLFLLPSASAISIDLLGQGRVDVAEEKTACVHLHPALDVVRLQAGACADASAEGLDVDAAAATSAAGISAGALAHADAGADGVNAHALAAGDAVPIQATASASSEPHIAAHAEAAGVDVGPVSIPEKPGLLDRIGSWLRGLF